MNAMLRLFCLREDQHLERAIAYLRDNWQQWSAQGKPLLVQVLPYAQVGPTPEQRGRYWGYLLANISEQATAKGHRYPAPWWHEQFKVKFIGIREIGKGQYRPMSSERLSPVEYGEFMERVEEYAIRKLRVNFNPLERPPHGGD